jgi:hypothetical protein
MLEMRRERYAIGKTLNFNALRFLATLYLTEFSFFDALVFCFKQMEEMHEALIVSE